MGNLTEAFKIKMCISIIQQFLKKYWVAQPLSPAGWGGGEGNQGTQLCSLFTRQIVMHRLKYILMEWLEGKKVRSYTQCLY